MDLCVKKRIERRSAYNRGEFHPLTYWQTLGYDIKRIEETTGAMDKEMNPQLGMCYRVHIKGSIDETLQEKERSEVLESMKKKKTGLSPKKRNRMAHVEASTPKKVKPSVESLFPGLSEDHVIYQGAEGANSPKVTTPSSTAKSSKESTSGSSSSSSSSSSSTPIAKKKGKKKEDTKKQDAKQKKKDKKKLAKDKKKEAKLKKKRQEEEKQKKEEERKRKKEAAIAKREKEKLEKQQNALAAKAISGLSGVRTSLDASLAIIAPNVMANIPEFVMENARDSLAEVEQMVRKAQAKIKNTSNVFGHTLEEIAGLVKKATDAENEVGSFTRVLSSAGVS